MEIEEYFSEKNWFSMVLRQIERKPLKLKELFDNQDNYFNLLNKTRKITKISLLGFIISLFIASIILLISLFF